MLRDKDDVEVEDTDETDEAIYGKEISQEKNDTASETYDSSKTYYTESNGVYTVAEITSFASGTTYYTMN